MIRFVLALALALSGCGIDPGEQIDDGLSPIADAGAHPGCSLGANGTYFCIRGPASLLDAGHP